MRAVRVLPDVSGINKTFDYLVPSRWAPVIRVGSLVRVDLNGRRVAGWVVDIDPEALEGVALREISKVSSAGPPPEVVDLAHWAAHRWAGRPATVLKSAMPERMLGAYPAPSDEPVRTLPPASPLAHQAFSTAGITVLQLPPSHDPVDAAIAAAALGDALIVTPDVGQARRIGAAVRAAGGRIGLAGRDFAQVAASGSVVGARSGVWSPLRSVAAVLVVDEHEESLQEERNPTWHARDVAIERARRAGVPCVLLSPAPSLAALAAADQVIRPSRAEERHGWPLVRVADQRTEEARRTGLFSDELVRLLRSERRVVCILNRKGRAPMLACASCGELVRTEDGERLMTEVEVDGRRVLQSTDGEERPLICAVCTGTKLKRLRLGVNRAAEELAALAGEPVGEVTAETDRDDIDRYRVLVGTEAALHRIDEADAVAFLDFDQELLAPRYRAGEQAMALVVRAARLVMRTSSDGEVLIQTRTPDHRVVRAAVSAQTDAFAAEESEVRRGPGFPPHGALAELSGAPADVFAESLRDQSLEDPNTHVLGPRADGRYLLRSASPEELADLLATTPRPKGRLRVAVDPPRV